MSPVETGDTVVLSVAGLRKRYSEVVGLPGPNGAGKTTTINMILGVLSPSAGSVRIGGIDLARQRARASMELAVRIVRSGFRPTFLVALWRGGAPIGIAAQEVLEYHGIPTDHVAIRTSTHTGIDQRSDTVRVHAIDYLVSRLTFEDRLLLIDDVFDSGRSPSRNRTALTPDYFVRQTESWLVFPHEIQGLTREGILTHKPVDPSFFDV